jgi:hypothetical protein
MTNQIVFICDQCKLVQKSYKGFSEIIDIQGRRLDLCWRCIEGFYKPQVEDIKVGKDDELIFGMNAIDIKKAIKDWSKTNINDLR